MSYTKKITYLITAFLLFSSYSLNANSSNKAAPAPSAKESVSKSVESIQGIVPELKKKIEKLMIEKRNNTKLTGFLALIHGELAGVEEKIADFINTIKLPKSIKKAINTINRDLDYVDTNKKEE